MVVVVIDEFIVLILVVMILVVMSHFYNYNNKSHITTSLLIFAFCDSTVSDQLVKTWLSTLSKVQGFYERPVKAYSCDEEG